MQLGCTAHHAIFDVSNDDGTIIGALLGVALDKAVVHEAVKAIMAAGSIQPQQMFAQQRQFLLLAERPNGALGARRTGDGFVSHNSTPRGGPRGGVESLDSTYCASQHDFQPLVLPQ